MQTHRTRQAREEHSLHSPGFASSWPRRQGHSPERLPSPASGAKGHLPQSSSPSFLETYSKYVESSKSKLGQMGGFERERESWSFSSPLRSHSQSIRAYPGASSQGIEQIPASEGFRSRLSIENSAQARSPDTRKDTTSSGYSSWPADASTDVESPAVVKAAARSAGLSAESLPSPSVHAAQHAERASNDWQENYYSSSSPQLASTQGGQTSSQMASHGKVAAVVGILESRSRLEAPSPQRERLTPRDIVAASEPSDASDVKDGSTSPWPAMHYQLSPRHQRQYDIEVRVHSPAGKAPADKDFQEDTARTTYGRDEAKSDEDKAAEARNAALAALLEERPELHSALTHLINNAMDGPLPEAQVQQLLGNQRDLVETLNALYSTSQQQSEAPFRFDRRRQVGQQEASISNESRRVNDKRFMVVMRNVKGNQLTGLETELDKQGIKIRRGWDEFARYLVPPTSKRYVPLWTFTFIGAVLSIFFFMAGGYASFLDQSGSAIPTASQSAPSGLRKWLALSAGWRSFDFEYLLLWGGQYLPAIKNGQPWRWITAVFLHVSFQHLLANMLLLAALSGLLELRYGSLRIFVVWVLSALGAAFFAGAFEHSCSMVVGSSGAVLGFVGLSLADLIVNYETFWLALIRLVIIVSASTFFIVTAITKASDYTSNWSHLGGFICGFFPSFLFLPSFKDQRWRKLAERMGILTARAKSSEAPPRSIALSATSAWQSSAQALPINQEEDAAISAVSGTLDVSKEEHASRSIPRGGIALPGLAIGQGDEAPAGQNRTEASSSPEGARASSSGENEAQDVTLVLGTERSDALGGSLPRIHTRMPSRIPAIDAVSRHKWQRLCCLVCPQRVHPIVLPGVCITLGVFVALPTYIYVVRIPATLCSV